MSDLHYLSIAEASALLRDKKLSPVEYTQALLDRIDALDNQLDAFLKLTPEIALADARRAETEIQRGDWRGPMHGVPFGLKAALGGIGTGGLALTVLVFAATWPRAGYPERGPDSEWAPEVRQARAEQAAALHDHSGPSEEGTYALPIDHGLQAVAADPSLLGGMEVDITPWEDMTVEAHAGLAISWPTVRPERRWFNPTPVGEQADRIREQLARHEWARTAPGLAVTASFGVATHQKFESVTSWMNRADKALYTAKSSGRNWSLPR